MASDQAGRGRPDSKSEQTAVGHRLRSARETLGLTQEDVASALGLQRTSVIAMEAGRRNVTALELRRLARLYRRDVGWILGEGPESLEETKAENQALFRATSRLSDEDREQVLRFAQFLASSQPAKSARASRGQGPIQREASRRSQTDDPGRPAGPEDEG
ncbi:helix-turn-helix transcriptional regulator [Kribbella kalugense]|uniref:DNA-binding XRE family transcriptional regulator n=1 Tax=Kribbella kalugense TaxID=2512221 RepID=A0A4R8A1S9_9ACTN|nr:DNA-binding XRE family transcriptional regulator [Kribbella kalugense]